jgi:putative transposase
VVNVSGKGSGRVSAAALIATRPGLRTRLCYTTRTHRGHKGERRSFAERD